MKIAKFRTVILALALAGGLNASLLSTFLVTNTWDPSTGTGGVFQDGGSYSGTFTLDATEAESCFTWCDPVSSFDMTTTGGTLPGGEYSSASGGGAQLEWVGLEGQMIVEYNLLFSSPSGIFELIFMEPGAVGGPLSVPIAPFQGGVVFFAFEDWSSGVRADTTGSAIAIDPEFLTPEPSTGGMLLGGAIVALILLARTRRAARPAGIAA